MSGGGPGRPPLEKKVRTESQARSDRGDYECSICYRLLVGNIYRCEACSKHHVCETCLPKMEEKCGHCREKGLAEEKRNRHLEGMCQGAKFDCVFKPEGCQEDPIKGTDATVKHENACVYNTELRCPFKDNCTWVGSVDDVWSHNDSNTKNPHAAGMTTPKNCSVNEINKVDYLMDPEMSKNAEHIHTQKYCFGGLIRFIFVSKWVRELGFHAVFAKTVTRGEEHMNYSIEIKCGHPDNEVTWKGLIGSIRAKHQEIIESRRCMLFADQVIRDPEAKEYQVTFKITKVE